MTSLYEYKHPIINKQLASGTDDQSGRKFPSLEAWYDVVNDYEFQARCPIILKNSHRNKHFTFACHLKDCPFKVLLSYCGNQSGNIQDDLEGGVQHEHSHHGDSLVSMDQKAKLPGQEQDGKIKGNDGEGSHQVDNGDHNHNGHGDNVGPDTRKYTDADAEDDDVSAAIAAAVAAVQDVRGKEEGQFGEEYMSAPALHGAAAGGQSTEAVVRGPFIVTKIEPYHNHPLESNLSLSKFVLTKVPRILQHDLNFDQILESLCNEEDNTVSKFRVSQYVEESGLLDILKERYGLTDADIDKKLLSHISRRVTTYKARFVLKKKKNGDYGTVSQNTGNGNASGASHYGQRSGRGASMNSRSTGDQGEHHLHQMNHHHHQLQQAIQRAVDDHENAGSHGHLQSLEDSNLNPELNDDAEAQAAAQAAMGEAAALKRSVQEMVDQEETDDENARKRQMMKLTASMHSNLVNDDGSLVSLDDTQDDKLPRDVAEQLRLLSSHFKEVEAHNMGNQSGGDGEDESKLIVKDEIPDENIQPELRGQ
ncbi:hypothetical protein HG535_0D03210 [Zygotorulaspora mrakii]|uniref:ARS-binding factor 1 n=1 Tax=Zygotorulaspora mrakii TaxID=42260 RepID=A0A7H9B295_ZYGMR|nr:uncharacterized protein HG535_0D03210 [Zygotorulaspora mrakii]QLG72613.1 hypothetical protein HG535_0D03210 [Zygotorulaspora mrakii]